MRVRLLRLLRIKTIFSTKTRMRIKYRKLLLVDGVKRVISQMMMMTRMKREKQRLRPKPRLKTMTMTSSGMRRRIQKCRID